jgi:hypothetical protein
MVRQEVEPKPVPDSCENCRETLQIVTVRFALLRARALFACPFCALAYAEPARRVSVANSRL